VLGTVEPMFGIAEDVEVGLTERVRLGALDDDLVARADRLHELIGRSMRELFAVFVEIDRAGAWRDDGARDLAHWIQMRYGISAWKAHRWIEAASALEALPQIARALETGQLGVDKAVELTRFASAATERSLLAWAEAVSAGAIRRRADLEIRRPPEASSDVDRERRCRWWLTDEGRRLELMAELPAADGALVVEAIERTATEHPEMPGEDRAGTVAARRADALVALCAEPTVDRGSRRPSFRKRPRIVVHAQVEALRKPDPHASNAALVGEGMAGLPWRGDRRSNARPSRLRR
jgi:hypothetical protein